MPGETDELILRAREGDEVSFKALVDSWAPRLLSFLRGRLGDEDEAQDAAQEVLVRVWSALPRFRLGENFAPWLFAIAANYVRSRWRSRAFEARKVQAAASELAAGQETDPAERAEGALRAQELRMAVGSLPEDLRRVVELYYFAGLDVRETAETLRLGEEAVKSRLFRARARLRALIERPQPGRSEGSTKE